MRISNLVVNEILIGFGSNSMGHFQNIGFISGLFLSFVNGPYLYLLVLPRCQTLHYVLCLAALLAEFIRQGLMSVCSEFRQLFVRRRSPRCISPFLR